MTSSSREAGINNAVILNQHCHGADPTGGDVGHAQKGQVSNIQEDIV